MAPLKRPPAAELQKLEEQLRANCSDLLQTEALLKFATPSCLQRFLVARQYNMTKATKMLRETLQWRATRKPETITYDSVEHIARPGRVEILEATDNFNRPVLIMRLRNPFAAAPVEDQINFLLLNLEHAAALADATGAGKMVWLLDMAGYSRKTSPPFSVSVQTLSILQNHYPERLGKAVVCNPSRMFLWLWRAIQPFLDPVTKAKVSFVFPDQDMAKSQQYLQEHFDMRYVDKGLGGERADFDPDLYGKRMRHEEAERWAGRCAPAVRASPDVIRASFDIPDASRTASHDSELTTMSDDF